MSIVQGAGRSCSPRRRAQDTQPRQSSCLATTAEKKTRQGRGMAAGFALRWSPRSSTPPLLGSAPAPQLPPLLPPSTATPTPCLGCVCHPELFPTDHLSFLSIPSPLAASTPSASRTLLLLLSCPLRWFVNFLAPGIQCSRGCRGSTVCWARWAGVTRPLPGTGEKNKPQSQKRPNQPPVSAMHPGFCTSIV